MPRRTTLRFTPEDLRALAAQRYEHPDPRVPQRMEVLWLISQGETQAHAGQLAGVSKATVAHYIALFRIDGVAGLRICSGRFLGLFGVSERELGFGVGQPVEHNFRHGYAYHGLAG